MEGFGDVFVEDAFLLEDREGVGFQNFRPLVAVVSCGISSGEDMSELATHQRTFDIRHDDSRRPGFLLERYDIALERFLYRMPSHIQESETQLPATEIAAVEVRRINQLLHQLGGNLLAGLVVPCYLVEVFLLGQPVLHDLRGELDEILVNARPRKAGVGPAGKHPVEGVAKLVQQSFYFTEGQERRLRIRRPREVHHDDDLRAMVFALRVFVLRGDAVHPSSGLLAIAGEEVGIEDGEELAIGVIDLVGLYFLIIYGDILVFLEGDAIELRGESEDSFLHAVELEVGPRHLVVHIELDVFQLLRIVIPVPRHDVDILLLHAPGESLHGIEFVDGYRLVCLEQLVEQLIDILRRLRHLVRQLVFGIILIAQEVGYLQADIHNLADILLVIVFVALVADTHVFAVHLLAQVAAVGIAEEGDVARRREVEEPAFLAFLLG